MRDAFAMRMRSGPRVEVLARVSRTGVANAQAGDLESKPVETASSGEVELMIDHARP